ncbi:exonuclease SbcCD subunit D [Rhodoferax lacus]|uniref:Nuclease SbcCD subunit D n=1 Tax=Rhodoferax lacus TaxID=2184758 RepID=A0A3E1R6Z2_9BURK|nr:exonuclease SbcCD subunit D C-terminal domain-containing protein [Rhodoferax lacus]RFO95124.1 exonuclease SbcCD subunit D [Rhodoferax lacus]
MKLLHTSDWHLGQSLNQFDRSYEHAQFLAWLLDTLVAEQVDALLIAGDVFDNTNPSSASQNQLYQFLTEARRRVPQLGIVMTAGNHDSPGRMEAPAPFLALLEAYVVGHTGRNRAGAGADAEPGADFSRIVVPLKSKTGAVAAWCIAMPFLRPGDVPRVEGAADAYRAGVEAIYAQAYAYALELRSPGQAIIALGHCHISGGQVSVESERNIVIGGAEALSAKVFAPGIAYVALGHLHLAQQVGGDATRRYCGSPLPMSFSEVDYQHQVVIAELDGEAVASTRALLIPRSVDMLRVPKQAAPLEEVLQALQALEFADGLTDAPQEQWPYLQVRVQLSQPEPGLRLQVEEALTGKPVRLVRIETSSARKGTESAAPVVSIDELSRLQPADYFERLYQHKFDEAPPDDLMAAFTELLNAPVDALDAGARP